jgi:hypothetical protein
LFREDAIHLSAKAFHGEASVVVFGEVSGLGGVGFDVIEFFAAVSVANVDLILIDD